MSQQRFKEDREDRFTMSKPRTDDPVLVVCPRCAGKASVVPHGDNQVKCSCLSCGYTSERPMNDRSFDWHDETPTDGYFGCDLWLRTDCGNHSLWAFNMRHLEFLQSYVSARLRERNPDDALGRHNSSLASRLPKWLKAGKHREAVLKAIDELKAKAQVEKWR